MNGKSLRLLYSLLLLSSLFVGTGSVKGQNLVQTFEPGSLSETRFDSLLRAQCWDFFAIRPNTSTPLLTCPRPAAFGTLTYVTNQLSSPSTNIGIQTPPLVVGSNLRVQFDYMGQNNNSSSIRRWLLVELVNQAQQRFRLDSVELTGAVIVPGCLPSHFDKSYTLSGYNLLPGNYKVYIGARGIAGNQRFSFDNFDIGAPLLSLPVSGTVSGPSTACIGQTIQYTSNGDPGGAWFSSNPAVAGINASTGEVTTLSAGTTQISYGINTGWCFLSGSSVSLTVSANADAGVISGASEVCAGATSAYSSNGTTGGTWSSDNTSVASIDGTGTLTAISPGTANISYTISTGCNAPASASYAITVLPLVNPGVITGSSPLCIGATSSFTSSGAPGGVWSSLNTSVATVDAVTGFITATGAGSTQILYTATTGCGAPQSASFDLTVSPNASAGIIGGPATVCLNGTAALSSNGDAGGTWSSSDLSVATVDPQTGVVTGVTAGSATIQYIVTGGCNAPASSSSSILVITGSAPVVTGIVNVCPYLGMGTELTYTAFTPGATQYNWTLPANVNLISGAGTATITVTANTALATQPNKQIRVTAVTACGTTPMTIFYMLTQAPGTPAPIQASESFICPNIGTGIPVTYRIPKVTAATSYIWTTQTGTTTIVHPNGPGENDTLITVTFASNFSTSPITVRAVNNCGISSARSLTIQRTKPSTPSLISGPVNACAHILPNGTAATYSIASVLNADSYNWSIPVNSVNLTGQGSNQISFIFADDFSTGQVTVTASNGCGTSDPRILNIATLAPATPSVFDVINTIECPTREYTYTLTGMPANAVEVVWTAPGTIISGQGGSSITVQYPATAVLGQVTATAVNNCGNSVVRIQEIRLPACETFTKGNSTSTSDVQSKKEMLPEIPDVSVYPNPSTHQFQIRIKNTDLQNPVQVRILDIQGRELERKILPATGSGTIGAGLKKGTYLLEILQGSHRNLKKLVKQ